jgi:hypothetical protein
MKTIGELVCKLIEYVGLVSQPGEQQQSLSGTAPVQYLELDARLDRDETDLCPEVSKRLRSVVALPLPAPYIAYTSAARADKAAVDLALEMLVTNTIAKSRFGSTQISATLRPLLPE